MFFGCEHNAGHFTIGLRLLFPIQSLSSNYVFPILFVYFSWAVSTVMTRQNSMPGLSGGQPAGDSQQQYLPTLIPLWDMANHIEGDLTTVFNVSEQQVEGSALMDFAKGEQIFIYYGRRRNSAFLTHNG